MCMLAQAVLDTERTETASVNVELRNARAELDKLEKERRAAAPVTPAARTTTSYYATQTPTACPVRGTAVAGGTGR